MTSGKGVAAEVYSLSLRPSVEWLLVCIPVVVVLDRAAVAAPLTFFVAALAIVPLAALIVRSTEHVAGYTGPAVGGLLNATFGNLPELIIAVVALRAGFIEMVRASLIGAVLANVLLALGVAFLLGGRRYHVMDYNAAGARAYASMLMLAVITLGFQRPSIASWARRHRPRPRRERWTW